MRLPGQAANLGDPPREFSAPRARRNSELSGAIESQLLFGPPELPSRAPQPTRALSHPSWLSAHPHGPLCPGPGAPTCPSPPGSCQVSASRRGCPCSVLLPAPWMAGGVSLAGSSALLTPQPCPALGPRMLHFRGPRLASVLYALQTCRDSCYLDCKVCVSNELCWHFRP